MAGKQLAQIGTHVLQTAVYKYKFYWEISSDISMLLVQDFTFFKGNYRILLSNSIILFWMELMMLSLANEGHIAKLVSGGCFC